MMKKTGFILLLFISASQANSNPDKPDKIKLIANTQGLVYLKGAKSPYNGQIVTHHPNGVDFEEKTYINGVLRKYFSWDKEGKKRMVKTFDEKGLLEDFIIWNRNGQKSYEEYHLNQIHKSVIATWNSQGQKLTEAHYSAGKADGLMSEWYDNGQKSREETRQNGIRRGPVLRWDKNGSQLP
jgi:antitoxin component YwqK of YwqJK toxin-antitoxin module